MGESKVIHQMKDKEKVSWKKEAEKKEQSEIDELLSMRRIYKEMNS
jgi:flagellar biosynthesis chaperone FliJ